VTEEHPQGFRECKGELAGVEGAERLTTVLDAKKKNNAES